MNRSAMQPIKVHAQLISNYLTPELDQHLRRRPKRKLERLTLVNNCTVKRGNAAATADRIAVFADNAEALYVL